MTDSMIEKVADAIGKKIGRGASGQEDVRLEDVARAAIAAMREPTEAMKEASSRYCQECADSLDAWHAGIDAALKEP